MMERERQKTADRRRTSKALSHQSHGSEHADAHEESTQFHKVLKKRDSALVKLRIEKIGSRDVLYSRKVPDMTSSRCGCGAMRQSVAHVRLHCRTHKDLRNRTFDNRDERHNRIDRVFFRRRDHHFHHVLYTGPRVQPY